MCFCDSAVCDGVLSLEHVTYNGAITSLQLWLVHEVNNAGKKVLVCERERGMYVKS